MSEIDRIEPGAKLYRQANSARRDPGTAQQLPTTSAKPGGTTIFKDEQPGLLARLWKWVRS